MKLTIARVASALAAAALAATTAASPAAASLSGVTVVYQSGQQAYLLEITAPAGGGPVTGTLTIAQPCLEPNGSTSIDWAGTFQVGGTYNPQGVDSGGDQFILTAASQDTDGTTVSVIGGLTTPVTGMIIPDTGLVLDSTEEWTEISQIGQFYSMVESIIPIPAYCS
jgi:hypothetical protein